MAALGILLALASVGIKTYNGGFWICTTRATPKGRLWVPNTSVSTPFAASTSVLILYIAAGLISFLAILHLVNSDITFPLGRLQERPEYLCRYAFNYSSHDQS